SQISNAAVNTFPGLVHTARHVMKVGNTRSQWPKLVRELSKVGSAIGTKSYQGSRTGRCGWITSFLWSIIYITHHVEVSMVLLGWWLMARVWSCHRFESEWKHTANHIRVGNRNSLMP